MFAFLASLAVCCSCAGAADDLLTIHELNFNTTDGDASAYADQVVDCAGGIVVGKFAGWRPRVILYDPTYADGWRAIQVKDWTVGDLFDQVMLGDWIELYSMEVEEFRGNTMLQWYTENSPGFLKISSGHDLPLPLPVSVADIPAPIEHPYDEWYVENHGAEFLEATVLLIRDVTVTRKDLGKAVDNYNLQDVDGNDCWAADYMNEDVQASGYHEFVKVGQHFCAVIGLFEQYTYLMNGWDYYQLITRTTGDLGICGDGDMSGFVDLSDFPRFNECLTGPRCEDSERGCYPPAWMEAPLSLPLRHCLMMDLDYDGDVDSADFAELQALYGEL
ncbi:MAG: hypothetical protein JSU63_20555 [Phycisphaerales bacterium]|nr:MAG: hypothetical protein JSU63_20555 [Phycisphaerales bacterium]